jgi:hypothetical protein
VGRLEEFPIGEVVEDEVEEVEELEAGVGEVEVGRVAGRGNFRA